jgi:hypothetical protein
MKSAYAYKSVVYKDRLSAAAFWTGRAVDKQINAAGDSIPDYWIKEFLASDLRTTSAAGTRRLAGALRKASDDAPDVTAKSTLIAAVQLASGMNGQMTSVAEFMDHFRLPDPIKDLVRRHVHNPALLTERFVLDAVELAHQVPLRSVELDNGGIMTAPTSNFDAVFTRAQAADGKQRFTTEGHVVDDKLRRRP